MKKITKIQIITIILYLMFIVIQYAINIWEKSIETTDPIIRVDLILFLPILFILTFISVLQIKINTLKYFLLSLYLCLIIVVFLGVYKFNFTDDDIYLSEQNYSNFKIKGSQIKEPVLKDYIEKYIQEYGDDETNTTYSALRIDLNNDLNIDAIVFLEGTYWCGSAGCTILVVKKINNQYFIINEFGPVQGIRIGKEMIHSWNNLFILYDGGLSGEYEEKYSFNKKEYE